MNRYLDWSYQHWTTKNILKHNRRSYEYWHMLFRNRSTRIIKSGNTLCQFCPLLGIWYCSVIFDCGFVRLIITRSGFLYLYIWHLKITVRFCTDAIKIGKTSLKGCLLLEFCSESMWPHKNERYKRNTDVDNHMWFPPNKAHCTIGKNHQFWSC